MALHTGGRVYFERCPDWQFLNGRVGVAMDVFWKGRGLAVHSARVSAMPFNRVWDGTQRPTNRTELAAFVTFDMDGPGDLEICVPDAASHAAAPTLLPMSLASRLSVEPGGNIRIRLDRPAQLSLLFKGAPALHVFANPPFKWPEGHGGLVTRFPPGEHDVGVVVARSGETIVLEEGAVVHGSILVANAHDVSICGRGIVDGSRLARADHSSAAFRAAVGAGLPPSFYGAEMAVNGLTVFASEHVAVEGVVFRDPPRWAVIVRGGSRDVDISNVKVVGCWRYNSDGMDVCASERVRVRDCFVRSFDDCLVARGDYLELDAPTTRDIVFERCTLWCDWGKCMEVWAGHRPCRIDGVRFSGMAVIHPSGTVCDVTTWFASADTQIRHIAFENIEVDFAGPLWAETLDTGGAFPFAPRETQELFAAEVIRYGRYLGNQQFEPAADLSSFHVRYEDIAYRHFRAMGDIPRLCARIDASTPPHTAERIYVADMPETLRLDVSGVALEGGGEREGE